jgi:thiamine biosynthesis lipoprotein
VLIDLNLKDAGSRRPFVAVWVEDMSKHLVRNVIFFYQARKPKYLTELRTWWSMNGNNQNLAYVASRPTPAPGRYLLHWDGLDDRGKPVPPGTYKVTVETAREHSYYEKESAQIVCLGEPSIATIKKTPEFDPVILTYGPKRQTA